MSRRFLLFITLFTSSVLGFSLSGCGKNTKANVKLTVLDASSGDPVSGAKVFFLYRKRANNSNVLIQEEVGFTNDDGYLHFKSEPGKVYDTKLLISAEGYISFQSAGQMEKISIGRKNVIEKKLTRHYYFLISVKNENCFNETDSVWINNVSHYPSGPNLVVGCADTTFYYGNYYDFTNWTDLPTKTIQVIVKRNGVTSSFEQTTAMIHKEITPIHIEY